MPQTIISGPVILPERQTQRQLHRQLGEFVNWLGRTKDAGEIQKDKRQSVPVPMLPMVF